MRRIAVLVAGLAGLAACGRFEFGVLATDDGSIDSSQLAPVDAAPVACITDGEPCDDRDICTASSRCSGSVCVGDPPLGPCTVADFGTEFSQTQGQDGWFYGAWNLSDDTTPTAYDPNTEFELFAQFDGLWRPTTFDTGANFTWAYILFWGGHPGSYPLARYPIRRWVSDVSGHANVELHFAKTDFGGDGAAVMMTVDGVLAYSAEIGPADDIGVTESIPIEVSVGTRVDVMHGFRGEDGSDSCDVAIRIVSR